MIRHFLILILFTIASCTKNTDELKTYVTPGTIAAIKNGIIAFADSVTASSKRSTKQESLIYTINDYSFHVSRYVRNSEVSLYIEHGYSASYGTVENRYYLKNGKVVLFARNAHNPDSLLPYKAMREFYNNGDLVGSDQKVAKTVDELAVEEYKVNRPGYRDIQADIKKLNDAIYQRGSFDLTLEGITEYPKARYLILSRNRFNSYRAALLIEKEDDLIKSIISNPEKYKNRKLDLKWKLKDPQQALYVSGRLGD